MQLSLSLRELFLVIVLVATVSLFLNIQAGSYGLLINAGNLVISSNVSYDVADIRLVQNEAYSIIGGRSLNQHGPEVTSLLHRKLNKTSTTLIKRLIQIEKRLMSISRQPIVALVKEHIDKDVMERLKVQNIHIQMWKPPDHLDWIDSYTVVQGGNWSVLLCTESNLCPAHRGSRYQKFLHMGLYDWSKLRTIADDTYNKVNSIEAVKEYINNSSKLCEVSRQMEGEFQGLDCGEAILVDDRRIVGTSGRHNEARSAERNRKMGTPLNSSLPDVIMLSTSGPLLRLCMLVTSLVPMRFYIHSSVFTGTYGQSYSHNGWNQMGLEEIFQFISETHGLGMSTRWWVTLRHALVGYLTQITLREQLQQHKRCDRCFLEVNTDVICTSIEQCRLLWFQSVPLSVALKDTLSITATSSSTLHDVIKAIQTSEACADPDSESCLTDRDLVYLLDSRQEQLVDANWIKIYPSKDGSDVFGDISGVDMVLRRHQSGLTNRILSDVEKHYARVDAENKNSDDLPYDTDVGVQNNEPNEFIPENYACTEDSEQYQTIESIHTDPTLDFKELRHHHLYAEVSYDIIIVRIWAFARSCRCVVKLDNKYNSPGARNVSIGLGNNTFHLLVIDKTSTDPKVVSVVTVSIYRHTRGYTSLTNTNNALCELQQDCMLPFSSKDECGLHTSRYKPIQYNRCTSGDAPGRWLVPCISCGNPDSCVWRDAKWQPFTCSYVMHSRQTLKQCLHGKKLLFLGDSTNRGIMNYIMEQTNGSLHHWDKIHNTRAYTNLNHNSTHFTFAYYPHFWLPSDHRPKFQKTIFQLIKSSLPLHNNASTVLIVGGVQWLARDHIDSIIEALKLKGLPNITVVIKGLGVGFHQPVEGVRFVPPEQQQALQQKESAILSYAKAHGFRVVSTFNMTASRYKDFLEGKCACHFHKVSKLQDNPAAGFEPGYSVSGDVNAAYSLITADQICGAA